MLIDSINLSFVFTLWSSSYVFYFLLRTRKTQLPRIYILIHSVLPVAKRKHMMALVLSTFDVFCEYFLLLLRKIFKMISLRHHKTVIWLLGYLPNINSLPPNKNSIINPMCYNLRKKIWNPVLNSRWDLLLNYLLVFRAIIFIICIHSAFLVEFNEVSEMFIIFKAPKWQVLCSNKDQSFQ